MNNAQYYLNNNREFFGEDGHYKLLDGLKQFVKPQIDEQNKHIIGLDVGCCIGDYINNIKDVCKEYDKILTFEPNPVNLDVLLPKINSETNIDLYDCCISNVESITGFYNSKDRPNNAGNGVAGLRCNGELIKTVNVFRLDTILNSLNINNILIKFIKIDTEGNDSNVIKSLGQYILNTKYIIFECSDCLDDNRGPNIPNPMKDIVDYLDNYGFDTYRLGTKKMLKVNGKDWDNIYEKVKFWSNCFAIKKDNKLINSLIDNNGNYIY